MRRRVRHAASFSLTYAPSNTNLSVRILPAAKPEPWRVLRQDPDGLVTDVGRRIAELRVRGKLTQEQFARALGSTLQYAQRIEAGRNLTLHSLAKVANALGVPVVELFATTTYRRPTGPGRPKVKRRESR
jgi:ribosome-binding protein aMBF1 (putative translation factor)